MLVLPLLKSRQVGCFDRRCGTAPRVCVPHPNETGALQIDARITRMERADAHAQPARLAVTLLCDLAAPACEQALQPRQFNTPKPLARDHRARRVSPSKGSRP